MRGPNCQARPRVARALLAFLLQEAAAARLAVPESAGHVTPAFSPANIMVDVPGSIAIEHPHRTGD